MGPFAHVDLLMNVRRREAGLLSTHSFKQQMTGHLFRQLRLSTTKELDQSSHTAAINSLALDPDEGRYLLAGLGDGTLTLHDLESAKSVKGKGEGSHVILRIGRASRHAHKHAVQTVSWYTDNGLFLTSGRDGKLKVWDPNAQLPIEEFSG